MRAALTREFQVHILLDVTSWLQYSPRSTIDTLHLAVDITASSFLDLATGSVLS